MPVDQVKHADGQRDVHKKYRPPGNVFDERPADYRTSRRSQSAETRPCADRRPPFVFRESRADNGETARHEQRGAHALDAARDDKLLNVRRQAAPDGRQRKERNTGGIYTFAPVAITERSSRQQQRGKKQRVGLDHPLQVRYGRIKLCLQRRQREIGNTGIDECHAGSEDGSGKYPRTDRVRTGSRRAPCAYDRLIARLLNDDRH